MRIFFKEMKNFLPCIISNKYKIQGLHNNELIPLYLAWNMTTNSQYLSIIQNVQVNNFNHINKNIFFYFESYQGSLENTNNSAIYYSVRLKLWSNILFLFIIQRFIRTGIQPVCILTSTIVMLFRTLLPL